MTKLNRAIDSAVAASIKSGGVPGAEVAVWAAGRPVHQAGYGFADLERGINANPHTVFRIGSLTKQFTAAAAIKLAAQGKIDLKAPVSDALPAFNRLPAFSALELMHQTAGLHSDESDAVPDQPAKPKSQLELAAEIAAQSKPFDFDPGTAWLYSNANYIVLGALIEAITGKPLDRSMNELVFAPLGLSTMAFDSAHAKLHNRAKGYVQTDDAAKPFASAPIIDPSQAGGAGAMRGTATDLCRWHAMLLDARLFDRRHLALMLAPGRLRDGRLSGDNRFNPDDASYGDTQYACGLLVTGPSEPNPSVLHYGSFYGFCGMLQTFTQKGVTVAALCNTDLGPGVPFRAIRKAVLEAYAA